MPLPPALFAAGTDDDDHSAASGNSDRAPTDHASEALLLRCPACRGKLLYFAEERALVCVACRLRFAITPDDIPVLLIEEADELDDDQLRDVLARTDAT